MQTWTADLLDVLGCPKCRGPLSADDAGLHCATCNVSYPVVDGIPHLLVDAGVPAGEQ